MNQRQMDSQASIRTVLNQFDNVSCINQIDGPNSILEFWAVNGNVVIFQLWDVGGWDYYIQGKEARIEKIANDIADYY